MCGDLGMRVSLGVGGQSVGDLWGEPGSPGRDYGLGSREKMKLDLKALEGRPCMRWGEGLPGGPLPRAVRVGVAL